MDLNIFEVAARQKFRFAFKGTVTVEELWDLRVEDLDLIYRELVLQIDHVNRASLLNKKTNKDEILNMKIDIITHIVNVKMQEQLARETERQRAVQKQNIMSVLANKQETELLSKSVEELEQMLEELN